MSGLVLVVEDNTDVRRLLGMLLRSNGYEVMEAGDGAQALEAARSRAPDYALIDLGLPDMSGGALAERLWEEGLEDVRCIACTGRDHTELADGRHADRFAAYFQKGSNLDELLLLLG